MAQALPKSSSVKRAAPHRFAKQVIKTEPQDAQSKSPQIRQQQLSRLPIIPSIFDGNPLEYRAFIKAFDQMIESKTDNMRDTRQIALS